MATAGSDPGSNPGSDIEHVLEAQARIERKAGRRYLILAAAVGILLSLLTVSNVIGLVLVSQRLADRDRVIAVQTLKISDRDKAIGSLVDEVILLQRQVKSLGGSPAPFTITVPSR